MQQLEIGLLEESLSGPLGVGRVSDDDIELVLVGLEELETVADVDRGLGALEAGRHVREILLG